MKISHKILNINNNQTIYLYITVEDIYEFGKENLGKGENTNFLTKLRKYAKENFEDIKNAAVVIVINGIVIGSISIAALYPNYMKNINNKNSNSVNPYVAPYETSVNVNIYEEKTKDEEEKIIKEENLKEEKKEQSAVKDKVQSTSKKEDKVNVKNTSKKQTTNNKNNANKTNSVKNEIKKEEKINISSKEESEKKEEVKKEEIKEENKTESKKENNVTSGTIIKLNSNGKVQNIELEEYIIGVVAAEMPAAFNSEALKSQAVVARTYAMNKHSKGITLINSTAHQVYNTKEQMKAKWGSSYSTYYNKIKNAVNATKGQVLKYNGQYIDALYYAISNGSSELPIYVWNKNYPYLQAVSSNWDKDISAGSYTVKIEYSKMSSKLKNNIDENTEIQILSKTAGNRVDKIKIGDKTYTGVEVRTALGLRSADFVIEQNKDYVVVKTKGFGHGVGMSQYGANGAAKAGYTYKQILKHYYPGTALTVI